MKNIVLIGLSGSGKSTIGFLTARAMKLGFVDLDTEVEKAMGGMPIKTIFAKYGEAFFRELEGRIVRETAEKTQATKGRGKIIATGGGVILRPENMELLAQNSLIVFIDRPPEQIAQRVNGSNRPLLAGDTNRIYALAEQRRPLYLKYAHVVMENCRIREKAIQRLQLLARSLYPEGDFAVIGDPIGHTLSPPIHRAVFDELGLTDTYTAIHVPKGRVGAFVEAARHSSLRGFNATIPHKKDIIPFLDEVEEEALLCGAVNTVRIKDGKLTGHNTDMNGLLQSIREKGYDYQGSRITIIGTGGAAAGIALKAAREQAACVAVLGRRPEKAEELCQRIRAIVPGANLQAGTTSPQNLAATAAQTDILLNATPQGMTGVAQDFPTLAFLEQLPPTALVCDLIYNPAKTKLLAKAEALGLATLNGLGMLIYQGLLADEIFLDTALDKPALFQTAHKALMNPNPTNSSL